MPLVEAAALPPALRPPQGLDPPGELVAYATAEVTRRVAGAVVLSALFPLLPGLLLGAGWATCWVVLPGLLHGGPSHLRSFTFTPVVFEALLAAYCAAAAWRRLREVRHTVVALTTEALAIYSRRPTHGHHLQRIALNRVSDATVGAKRVGCTQLEALTVDTACSPPGLHEVQVLGLGGAVLERLRRLILRQRDLVSFGTKQQALEWLFHQKVLSQTEYEDQLSVCCDAETSDCLSTCSTGCSENGFVTIRVESAAGRHGTVMLPVLPRERTTGSSSCGSSEALARENTEHSGFEQTEAEEEEMEPEWDGGARIFAI